MNVLFAPDWRDGVPYQRLLAEALEQHGVRVSFLRDYKRGLPLARLVRERARQEPVDVLHLHWPEAYYPSKATARLVPLRAVIRSISCSPDRGPRAGRHGAQSSRAQSPG